MGCIESRLQILRSIDGYTAIRVRRDALRFPALRGIHMQGNLMPTISMFYGMIIRMYYAPHEHPPPHFHVYYGEYKATVDICTCESIGRKLTQKTAAYAPTVRHDGHGEGGENQIRPPGAPAKCGYSDQGADGERIADYPQYQGFSG